MYTLHFEVICANIRPNQLHKNLIVQFSGDAGAGAVEVFPHVGIEVHAVKQKAPRKQHKGSVLQASGLHLSRNQEDS